MTRYTSTSILLADFAYFIVPSYRYRRDSLGRLQCLGISKLYFGGPNSTSDMNPVIVECSLQRLPRVNRTIQFHLFLSVVIRYLLCSFPLDSILFALLFGLLFVCSFGWLYKIMLPMVNWAEHTLVDLRVLLLAVSGVSREKTYDG